MPHEGIDPIPVACEIVTALSAFVARQIPVTDPAVLSITQINAGSAYNIVPDEVKLKGTLAYPVQRHPQPGRARA